MSSSDDDNTSSSSSNECDTSFEVEGDDLPVTKSQSRDPVQESSNSSSSDKEDSDAEDNTAKAAAKERDRSRSPLNRESHDDNDSCGEIRELEKADGNQTIRDQLTRGGQSTLSENRIILQPKDFRWVGTRRPSKSDVWKYFGFKKFLNQAVEYDKVYCKICGVCKKYENTTTNMKHHLNSKHPIDANNNDDVTQPKASDFFRNKLTRIEKYPKKHPKQLKQRKVLVKWTCKKNRPFSMVEDAEFSEFCAELDPKYQLPSRSTLVRDVEGAYEVEKEKMIDKLKQVPFLYGTNDGGSAINGESFLSNTAHYIDPETWELKHVTLGCTVMKEAHTAKNYRGHVDATEELFGIKGKVIGYTTDNENKMHKSFENDSRNGCIAHIQSKTMEKAVKSVGCISALRKKMRKLARLGKFPNFKYALEKAQKSKNLTKRKVLQEVKTRFTSTLTMFHSVMSFDQEETKECTLKKAKLNISAINEALEKVGTKKAKKLKLKETEIEMIVATAQVLEPICDMLTMLGGEKYVTGGIVLPYMKKIVFLTRVEDTDPKFIGDLKSFINNDFLQRCRANLNFDLLKKATFLDARFKTLKSIEPVQRELLKNEILMEMEEIEVKLPDKGKPQSDHDVRPKKRKRISLESDDEDSSSAWDVSAKKELEHYLDELKLKEDSDPLLEFWKLKASNYPRLSVLARKYLCVQATSTPSERVFSKMGNVVSKKRNKLTPEHTNATIFLASVL